MKDFLASEIIKDELEKMGMDLTRYRWALYQDIEFNTWFDLIREGPSRDYVVMTPLKDVYKMKPNDFRRMVFDSVKRMWAKIADDNFPEWDIAEVLEWKK